MKKLLALLMAGIMLFAFAACGGNEDEPAGSDETTTAAEDVVGGDVIEEETTAAEEETEEVTEVVTDASGEEVTDKEGNAVTEVVTEEKEEEKTTKKQDTQKPTQATSKKPESKAEVLEYYNKAVNSVKTGAKSVKQHYSKISLNGKTTLPGWIDVPMKILGGADKFINDQLTKNSAGAATYSGADIKAKFPVEGESYASVLTTSDIQSATCTEKDGIYTIKVVTKADPKSTTVKHGQGHSPKAFNVVLPAIVNDNIPGPVAGAVGLAEMEYPASTATITVDAATGKVLTALFDSKWTINFAEVGVIIPFTTLTLFDIVW